MVYKLGCWWPARGSSSMSLALASANALPKLSCEHHFARFHPFVSILSAIVTHQDQLLTPRRRSGRELTTNSSSPHIAVLPWHTRNRNGR